MTHGTIADILITDLIVGRENTWAGLYVSSRIKLGAAPELARENLDAMARYAEYLTGSEVASLDDIECDGGAVVRRGLTKVAVYRDPRVVFTSARLCVLTWDAW